MSIGFSIGFIGPRADAAPNPRGIGCLGGEPYLAATFLSALRDARQALPQACHRDRKTKGATVRDPLPPLMDQALTIRDVLPGAGDLVFCVVHSRARVVNWGREVDSRKYRGHGWSMEPLSETEKALACLSEAQEQFAVMTHRMERLKAQGASTALYEQLLRTLETSLRLMNRRCDG